MLVTKVLSYSGEERTIDLPITEEQIKAFENGEHVQNAFPHLNADQREFILTGMTPDEWDRLFPESDQS